jgi:hypothetical protein
MAHAISNTVVALGVENKTDLPLLAALGFDGAAGPGIRSAGTGLQRGGNRITGARLSLRAKRGNPFAQIAL